MSRAGAWGRLCGLRTEVRTEVLSDVDSSVPELSKLVY